MSIYRGYSEYTKEKGALNLVCKNTIAINNLQAEVDAINVNNITSDLTQLQNDKLNKTGGTITGQLDISGNLNVINSTLTLSGDSVLIDPALIIDDNTGAYTLSFKDTSLFIDNQFTSTYFVTMPVISDLTNGQKFTITRRFITTEDVKINCNASQQILVDPSDIVYDTSLNMDTPILLNRTEPITSITFLYYDGVFYPENYI